MNFLFSLCLVIPLAWYGSKIIKCCAEILYLFAFAISLTVVAMTHSGAAPDSLLWDLFSKGAFSTALFVVVMYMAVLPRGGRAVKTLFPIRAELSILACILTLGHNIAYGKTYFIMLLTRPERLEGKIFWAAICSVMLITLMLPLLVTSFPAVRKKMKARAWKKLQRLAYWFYGLTYVHVMLLALSFLESGRKEYLWNVLLYSAVFWTYGILRVRKALLKNHPIAAGRMAGGLTFVAALTVCLICIWGTVPSQTMHDPEPTEDPTDPVTYVDGTYFGAGEGYVGTTQVAVTVTDGRIRSVIVISSEDDKAYVEDAKALLPQVVDSQRTNLDAVSGATYTSDAILAAIRDALSTAVSTENPTS